MYEISMNVNNLVKIRIDTNIRYGYVRYAKIQEGTYTESELIKAFNHATSYDRWIDGDIGEYQYFDNMPHAHNNATGFCNLYYKNNKLMFVNDDTDSQYAAIHNFYFIHCPNSFTNCPFFANVVTLYSSDYRTMRNIDAKNNFCRRSWTFPDSNTKVIKNPTSSTVSLTWGSNVVSIDPLGYYIVPDIESKTIINNVITDVFTIDSNTCTIQDPTHIFNYNPGYDTAVNYNYLTLTSVNMIYVNEPIKIIDTDGNNGQISIPYGLYSYNQFWKYLSASYDQYLFYTSSPDRTIAYSTNENKSFTLSYQIDKISDDIECDSSLDIILNKVKDSNNKIIVSTFDNYFEISSINDKSFKLAEPWKYNVFLVFDLAYSFASFNKIDEVINS